MDILLNPNDIATLYKGLQAQKEFLTTSLMLGNLLEIEVQFYPDSARIVDGIDFRTITEHIRTNFNLQLQNRVEVETGHPAPVKRCCVVFDEFFDVIKSYARSKTSKELLISLEHNSIEFNFESTRLEDASTAAVNILRTSEPNPDDEYVKFPDFELCISEKSRQNNIFIEAVESACKQFVKMREKSSTEQLMSDSIYFDDKCTIAYNNRLGTYLYNREPEKTVEYPVLLPYEVVKFITSNKGSSIYFSDKYFTVVSKYGNSTIKLFLMGHNANFYPKDSIASLIQEVQCKKHFGGRFCISAFKEALTRLSTITSTDRLSMARKPDSSRLVIHDTMVSEYITSEICTYTTFSVKVDFKSLIACVESMVGGGTEHFDIYYNDGIMLFDNNSKTITLLDLGV